MGKISPLPTENLPTQDKRSATVDKAFKQATATTAIEPNRVAQAVKTAYSRANKESLNSITHPNPSMVVNPEQWQRNLTIASTTKLGRV